MLKYQDVEDPAEAEEPKVPAEEIPDETEEDEETAV